MKTVAPAALGLVWKDNVVLYTGRLHTEHYRKAGRDQGTFGRQLTCRWILLLQVQRRFEKLEPSHTGKYIYSTIA